MPAFKVSTIAPCSYCNFVTGFSILILPFTSPAIASSRLEGVMIAAGRHGMDLYIVFATAFIVCLAAVAGIWRLEDNARTTADGGSRL